MITPSEQWPVLLFASKAKLRQSLAVALSVAGSALFTGVVVAPSLSLVLRLALLTIVSLAALVGLLGSLYFGYRLRSNRAVFSIDAEGITDRSSLISSGLVRWDEVVGTQQHVVAGQVFLEVRVRDTVAVVKRQKNMVKRAMMRFNARRGWGAISVSMNSLPVDASVLSSMIESGRQRSADSF